MASYKVIFKPSVEKDLRSLPEPVVKRVFGRMVALGESPFPRGSLSWPVRSRCTAYGLAIIGLSTQWTRIPGKS
jgi:mRNA-degrading endonuclease RelE of RelBE toxin-antitoxin system